MPNKVSEMTEATTSFTDSGEAVISQKIEVSPDLSASSLAAGEFAEYYDIERTVDEIVKGGYKSVCPIPFRRPRWHLTGVVLDRTPVPRRTTERLRSDIQSFEVQAWRRYSPVYPCRHVVREVSPITYLRLARFIGPQLLRR